MKNKKGDIFFVGDSYCAAYDFNSWKFLKTPQHQHGTTLLTHPSIVSNHFNYQLHPHGYGGKSWWYSRSKFLDDLDLSRQKDDFDLKAIIFFHTDPGRLNNAWNESFGSNVGSSVLDSFYKNYYDEEFHIWSQKQWFMEIARDFKNVKTLHFSCFGFVPGTSDILPGMVFKTPLIWISLGELEGTDQEIFHKTSYGERRFNHFNDTNNQVLANVIIESLDQYSPGLYDLDLDRFDRPNKNAINWPGSGYGTK